MMMRCVVILECLQLKTTAAWYITKELLESKESEL